MSWCPSRTVLEQFLEEQMRSPDYDLLLLHVEKCKPCQRLLEELTADSDIAGRMTQEPTGRQVPRFLQRLRKKPPA